MKKDQLISIKVAFCIIIREELSDIKLEKLIIYLHVTVIITSSTTKSQTPIATIDKFIIECLDLGKLNKLHIEHDNALFSPDWFLDKVEVINMETDEKVVFRCHRWLGKKHDDHEIQRDLLPMND
ncbi:unnamed protein product [Rotaria sordida]|uniref:PLAT domain-containing protein n=1 Tax=Rotaria sordida TaxID=392033 RepID=A0A814IB62_9BILA|nr:unnamed protein product [Rotaria sordida]